MRRKVSALLGIALAMLLSVAVAIPASAEISGGKPPPVDPRFKYGLDYFYKEMFDPTNPSGVRNLNVNETVNPSKTGGSWYLDNVRKSRTATPPGTNKPLTGKLILPGQPLPGTVVGTTGGTPIKPPSAYPAISRFAGAARLLGWAGSGMGGVTQAPSNIDAIAATQGVSAGCLSNKATCSSTDMGKLFAISNCGHTASCKAIGGKDEGGNPIQSDFDWWKDTALPFLGDLWAKLTGQTDAGDVPTDGHYTYDAKGCNKYVSFTPSGTTGGTAIATQKIINPAKTTNYEATQWQYDCTSAQLSNLGSAARMQTVCLDSAGNTKAPGGNNYGVDLGVAAAFNSTTGVNSTPLCNGAGSLFKLRVFNAEKLSDHLTNQTEYQSVQFYEWVNPNPNLDTIEDTKTTTTVDCTGPNGNVFTYSETISKVGAFSEPACPPGFDLTRHDIKTATGADSPKTVDSAAAAPGAAAKYPLCSGATGPGCSLGVAIDGKVCTSTTPGCEAWADISTRQPSRTSCLWGTYVMPISDCYSLAEAYKSETGMVFDPKSGVWVAVDTIGNPVPVSPQPWNPTNPAPVAGATPGTTPSNPTSGFPSTGTDSGASDGCSSPAWSWNPREFVKNPVVCALKDAFVPKVDIQARSTLLANKAADTVPISWISTPIVGPSGGGCPNWNINVAGLSKNVVCDSSFTAAIVGSRGPMFTIVASAMIWPLIRGIWYALIPIVRVNPGSSK